MTNITSKGDYEVAEIIVHDNRSCSRSKLSFETRTSVLADEGLQYILKVFASKSVPTYQRKKAHLGVSVELIVTRVLNLQTPSNFRGIITLINVSDPEKSKIEQFSVDLMEKSSKNLWTDCQFFDIDAIVKEGFVENGAIIVRFEIEK